MSPALKVFLPDWTTNMPALLFLLPLTGGDPVYDSNMKKDSGGEFVSEGERVSFRSNHAIILKYWNGLTKKISQMSGAMSGGTIRRSRSMRSHWEALLSL